MDEPSLAKKSKARAPQPRAATSFLPSGAAVPGVASGLAQRFVSLKTPYRVGPFFRRSASDGLRQPLGENSSRLASRTETPVFKIKTLAPVRNDSRTPAERTVADSDLIQFSQNSFFGHFDTNGNDGTNITIVSILVK